MAPAEKLEDVLRLRRTALGMSQARLAKKLDKTASAVSGWERGERRPCATVVPDLSEALEMDAEELAKLVIAAER